jgi:hypothetical protein
MNKNSNQKIRHTRLYRMSQRQRHPAKEIKTVATKEEFDDVVKKILDRYDSALKSLADK